MDKFNTNNFVDFSFLFFVFIGILEGTSPSLKILEATLPVPRSQILFRVDSRSWNNVPLGFSVVIVGSTYGKTPNQIRKIALIKTTQVQQSSYVVFAYLSRFPHIWKRIKLCTRLDNNGNMSEVYQRMMCKR